MGAKPEHSFPALESIPEAPKLAAVRRDEEMQAVSVLEFMWFGVLDFYLCKHGFAL